MEQFHFLPVPELSDGVVLVRLHECVPHRKGNWAHSYNFFGYLPHLFHPVGHVHLRIGMNEDIYFGGNVGYGVQEAYRGHGYAERFCRLIPPVARAHGMTELCITTTADNTASVRTIEHLGAVFVGESKLPRYNELYKRGMRYVVRYMWDISGYAPLAHQPPEKELPELHYSDLLNRMNSSDRLTSKREEHEK